MAGSAHPTASAQGYMRGLGGTEEQQLLRFKLALPEFGDSRRLSEQSLTGEIVKADQVKTRTRAALIQNQKQVVVREAKARGFEFVKVEGSRKLLLNQHRATPTDG